MFGLEVGSVCSKCPTLIGHVVKLFEWLVDRLVEEDMELFLVQCLVLWNQRNAILHGDTISGSIWHGSKS